MTMTGQTRTLNWKKYYEMLAVMPDPTEAPPRPRVKVDLRGALAYARNKGIAPADLTEEEKQQFITPY